MNKSWASLLILSLFCQITLAQTKSDSSLTIYTYPASTFLDWSNPRSFVISLLGTTMTEKMMNNGEVSFVSDFNERENFSSKSYSSMGHTLTHARCQMSNGKWFDRWTGLAGMFDSKEVDKQIFKKKLGAGFLFYHYKDGLIASGEENLKSLIYYRGPYLVGEYGRLYRARPQYIQFKINPGQCDRIAKMVEFFASFHYNKNKPNYYEALKEKKSDQLLYFTPALSAYDSYVQRMKTGTGRVGGICSTYASGLLKIAGIYDPFFSQMWARRVTISDNLFGGTKIKGSSEERKVSISDILIGDLGSKWVHPGYATQTIAPEMPDLIWSFLFAANQCYGKGLNSSECHPPIGKWLKSKGSRVRQGQPQIFKENQTQQTVEGIVVDAR